MLRCCTATTFRPQPVPRAEATRQFRLAIAQDEFDVGPTCHLTNGDEDDKTLMLAGQFHKTLPHDKFGQVNMV